MKKFFWIVIFLTVDMLASAQPNLNVELVKKPSENKVEVLVRGDLFTSYIYPENLKKPVLWPVVTAGGNEITRQYRLKMKPGERADHPHHVGVWFNYGNVNGFDFWNNSESVPAEKAGEYGAIFHESDETLDFFSDDGHSATFRYRLAVFSAEPTVEEINEKAKEFETSM